MSVSFIAVFEVKKEIPVLSAEAGAWSFPTGSWHTRLSGARARQKIVLQFRAHGDRSENDARQTTRSGTLLPGLRRRSKRSADLR